MMVYRSGFPGTVYFHVFCDSGHFRSSVSYVSTSFTTQDKFVAVTSGQLVSLFGFHLPAVSAGAKTALANMHETGTYKAVKAVCIDSGKVIAMSASNVPSSPVVLVATSAKAIHAVDFYCGEKVLDIETKHERPVHSIVGNFGGMFTPRQPGTPDLVMTGASTRRLSCGI
jgi:hypothetical protein